MIPKSCRNLTGLKNVSRPCLHVSPERVSGVVPSMPNAPFSHHITWRILHHESRYKYDRKRLPTRKQQLEDLNKNVYDVLVVGAGATGCGCALDAASRGLKTALVDASDFGNGASSKSSKLIHGGLHSLQAALKRIDVLELHLLYYSLKERATLLTIAPHLVKIIPMMMPVDNYSDLTRYWLLLKLYDVLAGLSNVRSSHFLPTKETRLACPLLSVEENLKGSLVNYELQMDDARLCLALALTAARQGANVANYVEVKEMTPVDKNGIRSVFAVDLLSRRSCLVSAKCVINATGPFVDSVRRLDSHKAEAMAQPSAGTHIVLPGYFAKSHILHGLNPDDLFVMPWKGHAVLGCSDGPLGLEPTQNEVQQLLDKFRRKLRPEVNLTRKHVLSAWKGLRPNVTVPCNPIAERSILLLSEHNLLTIAGGNWTNYRAMAEDAIDKAVQIANLPVICECQTAKLPLVGAQDWTNQLPYDLSHTFEIPLDVAQHLASAYGINAFTLLTTFDGCHGRLHDSFPNIEAEIPYAVIFEYAQTAVDVVARRMRVAFLDVAATLQILPRVIDIMGKNLKWSSEIKDAELHRTVKYLQEEMGMGTVTMCDAVSAITADKANKATSLLSRPYPLMGV